MHENTGLADRPLDPRATGCETGCTAGHQLARRLDAEWATLRTARRSLDAARRWRSSDGAHPLDHHLVELRDLAEVVDATQAGRGNPGDDDAILLRLVELARGDDLAGRVVVQRLLPGLVKKARTYRAFTGVDDTFHALVAALCIAVGTYDIERRRRNVAASLLSDAVHHGVRKHLRRRSAGEVVRAPSQFADVSVDDDPPALVTLAAVIREARLRGVADRDLALIRELAAVGSPGQLAVLRGVAPRTIRNHRDRATAAIRAAVACAA